MIKRLFFILILTILGIPFVYAQEFEEHIPSIIPYPVHFIAGEGEFVFTEKTVLVLESQEMEKVAEDFIVLFTHAAKFTPKLKVGSKKGNLCLKLDTSLEDEAYVLDIKPDKIVIRTSGVKGAFYALQTLRQLLPPEIEGGAENEAVVWSVPAVCITDKPRFAYRGVMVDVARYFIKKEHLLRIIDCMGMLKLNKLHLHLTDDNGWRLEIKRYPLLTEIGSKKVDRSGQTFPERRNARQGEKLLEGGYYTQEDIREIVDHAARRQIEVIPEIAMPGHCNAVLAAYPLLACPIIDKYIGVISGLGGDHVRFAYCAGNDDVFTFLQGIIDEVIELFPSQYIHLGGDAIRDPHWDECPLCKKRMKEEGLDDEEDLLGYFMRRIDRYVRSKGRKVMGWEEIMDANLSRGAVIFDWHGFGHGAVKAGKHGHDFVMTPTGTMYLNRYQGPQWHEPVLAFAGNNTLENIYQYEPIERYWTMSMRTHLLGMQASLWTEFCEKPEDVDYLLFPRIGAVAETAWSEPVSKDWKRFLKDLDHHQKRWEIKGICSSASMYNIQHEVVPDYDGVKVALSCIRPDVEIRYTTDGKTPDSYSTLYRRPWVVKTSQIVTCATFKDGKQVGETLVLPIQMNEATGKNMLRSNPIEKRLINGVRGSLKSTDGEWASWTKNDSIALTFDVGSRKKLKKVSIGCLNDFGLAIHKPKKIEISLSDNDVLYWKVAERQFEPDEIFREGCFIENLDFEFEDAARYIRIILIGGGVCSQYHVRSGEEAQIYLDEVWIE